MAGPFFNDPAYGFPPRSGILSGQPAQGGILSGNGFQGLRDFWNSDAVLPAAAALIGGPTLRQGLAGAFSAAGPGMVQMRKRKAISDWMNAGGPKDPKAPETQALFAEAPEIAAKYIGDQFGATGGRAAEYGMTPVWGKDKNGKTVLMQMSNQGGITSLDTHGVEPLDPLHFVNTGTESLPVGSRTGEVRGGAIPIDNAGKAAATAQGEAQGAAIVNLPVVEDAARRLTDTIDQALNSPEEISRVTGPMASFFPNMTGTAQQGQAIINQIQGQTFLQAYQQLKGGGSITETEGAQATKALNKLSATAVDDEQYVKNLQEFRDEVQKLVALARKKAGREAAGGAVPAEDYFK